ncbi:MFS general substrate transporter [Hypoxylon rubiginosum]|uniref:MFS general substrate transporter n=1 Tax=Hypoxylon rubiginosum TaxID=110542 RepID=A0ACC0D879_9PEZI|nr:MFS general substrate transporter [Hypoxylon rubiginosum]
MAENIEGQPPPAAKDEYLRSWRLVVVIGSLCLGIFLLGLDMNIIGVAIPRITTDFKSLEDIAWYGSAYLLTITAFQPFFGNLYKYFNAKMVYLVSLVLFEVGSVVCASAQSSSILIFGRAFLGFGAAGLLQGALAIIGYAVRLDKVPLFQGVVVSSLGISVCVGPVLGGVLTDYTTWRWCFWINVPIGGFVVAMILLFVRIRQSSNQVDRSLPLKTKLGNLDFLGTVLFLGAICCLLLVLQWGGQTYPWSDSKCIGLFVGFGLLTVLFCVWQWYRGDRAIIPFRILRKRSIWMGALVLCFLGMSSLVYAYYLPIYFQSVQGVSTTQSGVRFIALVLPQIVGLVIVGAIVSQWGYYVPYMILGVVVTSIGAGLLTKIGISTPTVEWAAYMVINGLGIGMAQQLPYTALQAVLDPIDVATGNAIAVFSYQLGGAIGVAIGQNLLLNKLRITVPKHTSLVSPVDVIAVGATGLAQIAPTPEVLYDLRMAYSEAIRDTFILALAAACFAFPASCGMERLNIKHIAQERLSKQNESDGSEHQGSSKEMEPIVTNRYLDRDPESNVVG